MSSWKREMLFVFLCALCDAVQRRQALDQDACESNPCMNGGTCIARPAQDPLFTCMCNFYFEGATCADLTFPDPCLLNPCENGGNCTAAQYNDGFNCSCLENFMGRHCRVKVSTQVESSSTTVKNMTSTVDGTQTPQTQTLLVTTDDETTTNQSSLFTTSPTPHPKQFNLFTTSSTSSSKQPCLLVLIMAALISTTNHFVICFSQTLFN